jgi:hypothetical protein
LWRKLAMIKFQDITDENWAEIEMWYKVANFINCRTGRKYEPVNIKAEIADMLENVEDDHYESVSELLDSIRYLANASIHREYVKPGEIFKKKLPASEVCMLMRVVDKEMSMMLKENGMVQLLHPSVDGSKLYPYGSTITHGEAGVLFENGVYYYPTENCEGVSVRSSPAEPQDENA